MALENTLVEYDYRTQDTPRKVSGHLQVIGRFQDKDVKGRLMPVTETCPPCCWTGAKLAKHSKMLKEITKIYRFSNGTLELVGTNGDWFRYSVI